MAEPGPFVPLIQKYFERDIVAAAHSLESMGEDDAIQVIQALPVSLAVRAIRHLQVGYAAAVLKGADPELFKSIFASPGST